MRDSLKHSYIFLPLSFWQEGPPVRLTLPIIFLLIALLLAVITFWFHRRTQQKKPPSPPAPDTIPLAPEEVAAVRPEKKIAAPETVPISGQRPPQIGWQIAGLTDVGQRRELNEDSLLMIEGVMSDSIPYGLYVVADGIGGHQKGEVASRLTVESLQAHFTNQPPDPATVPFEEWLREAAMTANKMVMEQQAGQAQGKKMGSTLVMALVKEGQAHIANVGDSRAYHLTAETIHQISVDHSLVERLVQIGQITREEARTHKNRNVIYNTIGDKAKMQVSLYHVDLAAGDRLLLCSDGLNNMLTDEEILQISQAHPEPAPACQALVEAANQAGGTDNITTIILQMNG